MALRVDEIGSSKIWEEFLLKNYKIGKFLTNAESFDKIKRSKETKEIVKNVRNDLNRIFGQFRKDMSISASEFEKLGEEIDNKQDLKDNKFEEHKKILIKI